MNFSSSSTSLSNINSIVLANSFSFSHFLSLFNCHSLSLSVSVLLFLSLQLSLSITVLLYVSLCVLLSPFQPLTLIPLCAKYLYLLDIFSLTTSALSPPLSVSSSLSLSDSLSVSSSLSLLLSLYIFICLSLTPSLSLHLSFSLIHLTFRTNISDHQLRLIANTMPCHAISFRFLSSDLFSSDLT